MTGLSPRYERELSRLIGEVADLRSQVERQARAQDTRLTTIRVGEGPQIIDESGEVIGQIGGPSGELVEHVSGPKPDAPAAPVVEAAASAITVTVADDPPVDARVCRVHASVVEGYEPSASTIVGAIPAGSTTTTVGVPAGLWHVRVQWVTLSGQESDPSEAVSVEVVHSTGSDEIDAIISSMEAYGGTEPPTEPSTEGRIYFQKDAEGVVVAAFRFTNGEWVETSADEIVSVKVTTDQLVAGRGLIGGVLLDGADIWANEAFVNAVNFGSTVADQTTRIDPRGISISQRNQSGELMPAGQLGGGEIALNFWNVETGEPIGGFDGRTGDVTGGTFSARRYEINGRQVFGDLDRYPGDGPILDALPKGERSKGIAQMSGRVKNESWWLPLECESFYAEPGRAYRIDVSPFRMATDRGYFLNLRYTLDGSAPGATNGFSLGNFPFQGDGFSGSIPFTVPAAGMLRMGVRIYAGSAPIEFSTSAADLAVFIYDEGPATYGTGVLRDASPSNPDDKGLVRAYHTAWPSSWLARYANGNPYTMGSNVILQGRIAESGLTFASQVGGFHTARGVGGMSADAGATIPQALTGAMLLGGTLGVTGYANPSSQGGELRVFWHTNATAPESFDPFAYPGNPVGSVRIAAGRESRLDLPAACLNAIEAGEPVGFSFHPNGSTAKYISATKSVLRLRYER